MLVIRLFRIGKKNQSSFKIVVTDKKNPPRGGRFVEQVGVYNPLTKEKSLQKERIQYWVARGAQPSSTIHNLLVKEGILEGKKIPVHKKSKKQEAATPQEAGEPRPAETGREKPTEKPAEEMKEVEPLSSESAKEEMKEIEPQSSEPQANKAEELKKEKGL